ncbi:MAG: hypothetical protein JNL96_13000 [Planctomycetaceae bacterium]|nr:hypothetical protein [Planctomycetaceae bacterium]
MIDVADATNEQIFWIIVTAYIGRALGLLGRTTEQKLDALFVDKEQNWTEQVERALSIDATFVKAVYALCAARNSAGASIGFLLRGLGCPPGEVDARVRELNVAL